MALDDSLFVGVDWASGSWIVVALQGDKVEIAAEPSILNVWYEYGRRATAVLIDIPIGLSDGGPRECDQEAKTKLGERGSTVFNVPCRDAVESREYHPATELNEDAGIGGLGCQSWGLIPRIREVDIFLTTSEIAKGTVFESHPELCFHSFAGKNLGSKMTAGGKAERVKILRSVDEAFGEEIAEFVRERDNGNAEWHHRIQSGRIDDVLDAAVLALTAKECHPEYAVLPEGSDPTDVPVMVYPRAPMIDVDSD